MTPLPDVLPIRPFEKPVRGEVTLPGSKSLTNRALLLAALCDRPVTLTNALFSEDTELMAGALRRLGFTVTESSAQKTIQVEGRGGIIPAERAELHVGLAGTAARFLTAVCAAAPRGVFKIDGIPQMRRRPMKGLIDALRALGADIRCLGSEGFLPVEIRAHGLQGGPVAIDASESSQMLSALLMVAPLAVKPVEVTLLGSARQPFVQMTARLMEHFGQPAIDERSSPLRLENGRRYTLRTDTYAIEPDATAASYFLALPLAATRKGALFLRGFHADHRNRPLQGDVRFAEVVEELGCEITRRKNGVEVWFPGMAYKIGGELLTREFREFSDTFPTLAAIAPRLDRPTRITGIAHTRKQETDRVAGMARTIETPCPAHQAP